MLVGLEQHFVCLVESLLSAVQESLKPSWKTVSIIHPKGLVPQPTPRVPMCKNEVVRQIWLPWAVSMTLFMDNNNKCAFICSIRTCHKMVIKYYFLNGNLHYNHCQYYMVDFMIHGWEHPSHPKLEAVITHILEAVLMKQNTISQWGAPPRIRPTPRIWWVAVFSGGWESRLCQVIGVL